MVSYFTENGKKMSILWSLLKPHKLSIFAAFIAISTASLTVLALGWGIKNLVDDGFAAENAHYLNKALLVLLGVIVVLAASSFTRFYLLHKMAQEVIAKLRKMIFEHLLTLDVSYFETHEAGDNVSRINTDTTVLQMVMTTNLPVAFRHSLTIIGSIIMLFIVNPSLTAILLLVVPIVVVPIIYFGKKVRSKSRTAQDKIGDVSSFTYESLQGLQVVQSFGYEAVILGKFSNLIDITFNAALKYVTVRAFLTAFVILMVFGAIGVVLWLGGHKVLNGDISAGDLSAFIFYAIVTAGAVGSLSESMTAFNQARGAADRIFSLFSKKSELKGVDSKKSFSKDVKGKISFENVSFSYPTRSDDKALSKASFLINDGEIGALVGQSGAGKTTVFQLLQRFYDPSEGIITIDGLDITEYNPSDIRNYIGVVSQDAVIFSTSIIENLRIGKPDASDEEIYEAAKKVNAHDFIMKLPQGYDTEVGEHGGRLSGGQKQRIAIARVLLKDPKILLLDEATSALDAVNEETVMEALKVLMKDRTTIIIAHRFSTVQNADKIVVFENGTVLAEGTHKDLYKTNDLYAHLAGLQMWEEAA